MTRELIEFSRGNTELRLKMVPVPELVKQLQPEFHKCRIACDVQLDVQFDGSIRVARHRILRGNSHLGNTIEISSAAS